MLPNSRNNSLQVKRMMYSKVKEISKDTIADETKKINELREIFTHSKTFVSSRTNTNTRTRTNDTILNKSNNKTLGTPGMETNVGVNTYEYIYPFITETISPNIDETAFNENQQYTINVCVYRVLDSARLTTPFLQFKLQKLPHSNELTFPSFRYTRKRPHPRDPIAATAASSCRTRADDAVAGWFHTNVEHIEFRGMYKLEGGSDSDSVNFNASSSVYLIYEEVVDKTQYDKLLHEPVPLSTSDDAWWWACCYEIFNHKRILFHVIHSSVLQLFESAPTIMFLYDSETGYILEAPHVLYSGITEGSTLEEMALLGPRKLMDNPTTDISIKDKNEHRMYGTQFYFHELDNAFRSACYTYDPKKNKYAKRLESYLFRYVVFLGITHVTIMDTDNTTMHKSIDSLVSHQNTTWCSEGYNSIYHGRYDILKHRNENFKFLEPVFCVCDNDRIITLSYHKVDASTVPKQFTEGTNTYTIL